MPLIRPRHVLSFSSEDVVQPAQNILKSETYRKWRCATGGEKQASVILEVQRCITGLFSGNNGSALVEVLVGRSSWSADEQYQVLLVASSFMSPSESKSFTNTNRVRIFGPDKLSIFGRQENITVLETLADMLFDSAYGEHKGVVFVLSGFVNPERGNLRDKALQMGAQYKQDWNRECTHLVCAFANTPKFNQVKGKGKIVTKKWIFDSFAKSKRLSTRHYHLPGDSSSSAESTDEEEVQRKRTPIAKDATTSTKNNTRTENENPSPEREKRPIGNTDQIPAPDTKREEPQKSTEIDDIYGGSTDEEDFGKDSPTAKKNEVIDPSSPPDTSPSDPDTEDELRRVQNERGKPDRGDDDNIFGGQTEGEEEEARKKESADDVSSGSDGELPLLPDFFSHKHFMLYGEIGAKTRRLLIRYITAYNGTLEEYMSDSVEFVITNEDWDQNFDEVMDLISEHFCSAIYICENPSPEREKRPIGNTEQIPAPDIKREEPQKSTEIDDIYGGSTDEEDFGKGSPTAKKNEVINPSSPPDTSPSDPDTEDELRRVQNKRGKPDRGDDDDIFGGQTEGEEEEARKKESADDVSSGSDGELPVLPDFFSHKHFMLYGEIGAKTRRLLIRYITAYNGTLEEYMSDSVEFVITNEDWDQNFDEALKENTSLAFVRPKWIIVCHEKGALVPCQPYIVAPS
ncbi:PREDICTED: DNA repair protein XRCC1-like [Acropora digitifera]|uniref:DNA repair protein XRCC1-like n=1 Tax=Acropora digitifera TaxID=70779 RepID=UPI00077A0C9E|nr:PREDICTED: DNA repair protein XRCC1-like [Acropora digitifera]